MEFLYRKYGNYHKPYMFMSCQEKPNFHYESVVRWFLWALVVLVRSGQVWELFLFDVFWVLVRNFR